MLEEALRYLGIQGEADTELLRLVLDCAETVKTCAHPKFLKREFSPLEFAPYCIGEDIKKHVLGAQKIMLLAATLGHSLDIEIKKTQMMDMRRAAVLDACASAYIEEYCDILMPEGMSGAMRFSPGYGDYPLEVQPMLLQAIKAEKIGITALESYMLLPTKSVTAVIGLKNTIRGRGEEG